MTNQIPSAVNSYEAQRMKNEQKFYLFELKNVVQKFNKHQK